MTREPLRLSESDKGHSVAFRPPVSASFQQVAGIFEHGGGAKAAPIAESPGTFAPLTTPLGFEPVGDRGAGWAYWAPAPPVVEPVMSGWLAPALLVPPRARVVPAWEARNPADAKPATPAVRKYFTSFRRPRRTSAPLEPCPICGTLAVLVQDHCHVTGLCRDRLCTPCNVHLGQIEKPLDVLAPLLRYVAGWELAHGQGGTAYSALLERRRRNADR